MAAYRGGARTTGGSQRDLDCAGGTGDNPAAPGPAQTVGADPNRLYGDGDGIVLAFGAALPMQTIL